MKVLVLCLALAVVPAQAGPPDAREASIRLYTSFHEEPPPGVVTAIQDELQRIMTPTGMRFEWRAVAAAKGEVSDELAVVDFNGVCDTLSHHSSNSITLGWTHLSDGVILPFTGVDCDAVRSLMEANLRRVPKSGRDTALGRALARVLAHELYHVFANTVHHGKCGVGMAAYSAVELLAPEFRFEKSETQALRKFRAKLPSSSAGN